MIGIVTGFNAMNRWTGPLRLTQEEFREFLTPTPAQFAASVTRVGPAPAGSGGLLCMPAAAPRPPLEPRSDVEARWAECLVRKSRFPLVDESTSRGLLPSDAFPSDKPLPNWVRLLVNFPKAGPARVATLRRSETKGNLAAKLNAQLAWVSARADRAWYALAYARDRLALGLDDESIFAIDQASDPKFTPGERAAFAFAHKLTVDPALISDADFDELRKFYSESEIAEVICHVNHDVFFNRVTEAAQLPLERSANEPSRAVDRDLNPLAMDKDSDRGNRRAVVGSHSRRTMSMAHPNRPETRTPRLSVTSSAASATSWGSTASIKPAAQSWRTSTTTAFSTSSSPPLTPRWPWLITATQGMGLSRTSTGRPA